MLTLITRGRKYYASGLAANRACVALASVAARERVSASAAEASFQVPAVLLTCSARDRALRDLNGLVEKKAAFRSIIDAFTPWCGECAEETMVPRCRPIKTPATRMPWRLRSRQEAVR